MLLCLLLPRLLIYFFFKSLKDHNTIILNENFRALENWIYHPQPPNWGLWGYRLFNMILIFQFLRVRTEAKYISKSEPFRMKVEKLHSNWWIGSASHWRTATSNHQTFAKLAVKCKSTAFVKYTVKWTPLYSFKLAWICRLNCTPFKTRW